ncbi:hypothetical protein MCAP1_001381 [Malassezia caprae]|uniref:HMG box domain-containing protein n=1 Tax=Malassezia caprae TaxID=1381934 RepID=A0AAF0E7U4_9BASI|nr:hypothetical protein MCAP1_001381 [Malassezia caprae]
MQSSHFSTPLFDTINMLASVRHIGVPLMSLSALRRNSAGSFANYVSLSYASLYPAKGSSKEKTSGKQTKSAATKAAKPKAPVKKDKPWERRDPNSGELIPLPYDRKPTKRPRFVIFFMERLQELKEKPEFRKTNQDGNKVFDIKSAASTIGAEWKKLPDSERARVDKLYAQHVSQYEKDLEAWQKSLTPDDIQRQNQFLAYQRKTGKKTVRRNIPVPDNMKRPLSAFFLFAQHLRANSQTTQPVYEFAKEAGAKWKALSAKEKEPFEEQARADKEEYNKRMERLK